ncbi:MULTISPECIES: branched-chain amino acid ABC transporter permease [unclassified Nocardioides]|uniref:branched-chain amino acid ABC transporter permease n=1 Tax=unclassified Nocardioides TaxID=2615069 RepID=UPI00138F22A5|nr:MULTISPECIES: branched-chain amino acid ABC transporter permease [unclassified Nocardioides]
MSPEQAVKPLAGASASQSPIDGRDGHDRPSSPVRRLIGAGSSLAPMAALIAVLLVVGAAGSELWIDVANLAIIAALGAIGLDLLLGHTGLISVGNAALLAIGAFVVATVNREMEVPFLLAVVLSGVACGIVGMVVALPALRITGLYLAVATMGFHFVTIWALREWQTGQVGDSGFVVPIANVFGFELLELRSWFIFLSVCLVVVLVSYRALVTSRPGRALHAIRERPALALMSGISVTRHKVSAFALSSVLIGVSGAFTAYYIGNVSYGTFASFHIAIEYLAMVILGGLGTVYGPVIGAGVIVALPYVLRDLRLMLGLTDVIDTTQIYLVQGAVVGLVVSAMVIFQPRGLVGIGASVSGLFRRKL